jgi:hypothetical protein
VDGQGLEAQHRRRGRVADEAAAATHPLGGLEQPVVLELRCFPFQPSRPGVVAGPRAKRREKKKKS